MTTATIEDNRQRILQDFEDLKRRVRGRWEKEDPADCCDAVVLAAQEFVAKIHEEQNFADDKLGDRIDPHTLSDNRRNNVVVAGWLGDELNQRFGLVVTYQVTLTLWAACVAFDGVLEEALAAGNPKLVDRAYLALRGVLAHLPTTGIPTNDSGNRTND